MIFDETGRTDGYKFNATSKTPTQDDLLQVANDNLSFAVHFSIILVFLQLMLVAVTELFRPTSSPLDQAAYWSNNLDRIAENKRKGFNELDCPCGPSRDFLAPFLATSACAFWLQPLMARVYVQSGSLPFTSIPGGVRFFGSTVALSFIIAVVLPLRRLLAQKLRASHLKRMIALILLYVSMLVCAGFFCHFVMQAMMSLK